MTSSLIIGASGTGATGNIKADATINTPATGTISAYSTASVAENLNVWGTVNNEGSLVVGRYGIVNVKDGGVWTQTGPMTMQGNGGYGAQMSVETGATFTYAGTAPMAINGAEGAGAVSTLTITGTFITSTGFQMTNTATTGTGNVKLNGGTIQASADIENLVVQGTYTPNFVLDANGGTINTNGFNVGITSVISGGGKLIKTGNGTLTLSATNTYSNGTQIDGGVLKPTTLNGAYVINENGTLELNVPGSNTTYGNAITGSGTILLNMGSTGTAYNTHLSSIGSEFTGTIELKNTSGAAVTNQKLNTNNAGFAPSADATIIVNPGTQLFPANGTALKASAIISGTGNSENRGAIRLNKNMDGNVMLSDSATIGIEGGNLSGNVYSVATSGTQTLTLGTGNSTGNSIFSGNITDGTTGGKIALTLERGNLTLSGQSQFSGDLLVNPTSAAQNIEITLTNTATLKTIGTVQIGNNVASGGYSGAITNSGAVDSSGALYVGRNGKLTIKSGGTWTQSGGMTLEAHGGYSCSMTVEQGGVFTYSGSTPIAINGAQANSGSATLTIAGTFETSAGFQMTNTTTGTGKVTLNGGTIQANADIANLIVPGTAANNTPILTIAAAGGTINTNGHDVTINSSAVHELFTGSGSLNKTGTGTLYISGKNSFTGSITISAGTLAFSNGALEGASSVVIESDSILLDNGLNEALKSLTLNGSQQTMILPDGAGYKNEYPTIETVTLTDTTAFLLDSNGVTFNSNVFTDTPIILMSSSNPITNYELAAIDTSKLLTTGAQLLFSLNTYSLDGMYFLAAVAQGPEPTTVPEPSTWALLLLASAGLFWLRRKQTSVK